MLTSAVRHRLLERHLAVLIHVQLAVHLAVRIRHVHPLVRNQRHARRKFRHGHGNFFTGKHVVVVTGHTALHPGQVGAFHCHRHRSSIAHLVVVSVRHRELEGVLPVGTGSRKIIMELSRLRIQRHGLAVHIERPVLAVSAGACNLLTAVHGKLDLRAFAVVRAEVEVHRTIDAFSVCAVEILHRQRGHVVHDIHSNGTGALAIDQDLERVRVHHRIDPIFVVTIRVRRLQRILIVDGELAIVPCGLSDGELAVAPLGRLHRPAHLILSTDRHLHTADGHRTSLAVHVHHQLARVGLAIGLMHQTIFVDQQIRLTAALINGGRDDLCTHRHRACGRIAIGIRHRDAERIAVVLAIGNVLRGSCVDDLVATFSSAFDLQVVVLIVRSDKRVGSITLMDDCEGIFILPDLDRDRGRFSV